MPNVGSSGNSPMSSLPVVCINGFYYSSFVKNIFIMEYNDRIYWGFVYDITTDLINVIAVSEYTPTISSYRDRSPFVDVGDSYKVYFASDRYGKGNFDLYRYNTKTFEKSLASYVSQVLPSAQPQLTNVGAGGTMGELKTVWTPVPIAAYYYLEIGTNASMSPLKTTVNITNSTTYNYSGGVGSLLYYCRIRAVCNGVQSQISSNASGNAAP